MVDIPDVVTYTNFGDHRLRGFWVAGGQISPSPIDFHRRPYNTLALSCECVITTHNVETSRVLRVKREKCIARGRVAEMRDRTNDLSVGDARRCY